MLPEILHQLATDWNRAGTMFNAEESSTLPDLEQLLIRTATAAREEPVLMPMAATWLARHGNAIAEDRLAHLIRTRLDPADQPGMGLLLDSARQINPRRNFSRALRQCKKSKRAHPLYADYETDPLLIEYARLKSSPLALKWGLYADPIEPKHDAMRARWWVPQSHPMLQFRADCMGDLRVSIVASLLYDEGAGESELALCRACGASRTGLRDALDRLEMAGRIERIKAGHTVKIRLRNEAQYR